LQNQKPARPARREYGRSAPLLNRLNRLPRQRHPHLSVTILGGAMTRVLMTRLGLDARRSGMVPDGCVRGMANRTTSGDAKVKWKLAEF